MTSCQSNIFKNGFKKFLKFIGLLVLVLSAVGCLRTKEEPVRDSSYINPKTVSKFHNSKPISRKGKEPWLVGYSWLEKKANKGDMLAKYFLARAHLISGRKIKLYETFKYLGLPPEARPYWEAFQHAVQERNISWDISLADQLSEEGTKADYGPLISLRGLMFRERLGGLFLDYKEAVRLFFKAADQEDATTMTYLGWSYAKGQGVGKDLSEAVRWYQKAADGGQPDAMFNLGISYIAGQGVAQNEGKGFQWLGKAAALDHVGAMYFFGMYRLEQEFPDEREAVQWFEDGGKLGHVNSMLMAARVYHKGIKEGFKGYVKNDSKAVYWYQKAADTTDDPEIRREVKALLARGLNEETNWGAFLAGLVVVGLALNIIFDNDSSVSSGLNNPGMDMAREHQKLLHRIVKDDAFLLGSGFWK